MDIVLAIIGAGRQGARLADAAERLPGVRLAIVADIKLENAKRLAHCHHCAATSSWRVVCQDKSVDAVLISAPNVAHYEIAAAALISGKHVLVEKPLATNLADASALCDAAVSRNLVLRVGFCHIHRSEFIQAFNWIHSKRVGSPLSLSVNIGHGRFMDAGVHRDSWFCQPKRSGGGVAIDLGIHGLDLFYRLLKPEFGIDDFRLLYSNARYENVIALNVPEAPEAEMFAEFEVGGRVRCRLLSSWLQARPYLGFQLEAWCTHGYVVADLAEKRSSVISLEATEVLDFEYQEIAAYIRQLEKFRIDIVNETPCVVDEELGAQMLLDKIYSWASTAIVTVPK